MKRFWQGIDLSSLQFRLTLGISLVSLLGLGGLAFWTSWKTQQLMLGAHRQSLNAITQRLPTEVDTIAPPEVPPEERLQLLLDHWSSSDMWLWAMQPNGDTLFADDVPDPALQPVLLSLAQVPSNPQVYQIDGRHLVLCKVAVDLPTGRSEVYIAKDVTEDYTMLVMLIRNLGLGTVAAIALFTTASSVLIWRSLTPLRQTQLACTQAVSTQGITQRQVRLDPTQAPGEMKDLVQTWNQLLDRLAQTGEQQRQFTSDVSHELRTPLSVIYGYLQSTLRRGTNLTPQQREALQIAADETEHTIRLLQDLLDLARAECEATAFAQEPLVLTDVVNQVLAMSDTYQVREFIIQSDLEPIVVSADPHYLPQVLAHLLDNACQFSPPDRPIHIQITRQGHRVTLAIQDQGVGIAPEQQQRIFEPFYRVDPSRAKTTGGVGVGLAIARTLTQGMGGNITVTSTPGLGSTFTIHLHAF